MFDVVREPMLALLLGGGAVYLVLGNLQEAIILLLFATMSVVITVVQEARTERVLEALRDITRGEELTIDYDLSFGDEHVFGDKELAADDGPVELPHDPPSGGSA